jgi:hypothetical protein
MALFDRSVTNKFFITDKFALLLQKSNLTLDEVFSDMIEKLHKIIIKLEQRKANIIIEFSSTQLIILNSLIQSAVSNLKKQNKYKSNTDFTILSTISHKLDNVITSNQEISLNKLEICTLLSVFEEMIELKLLPHEETISKLFNLKSYLTSSITGYFTSFIFKKSDNLGDLIKEVNL